MRGFEGENFRDFRNYSGLGSPWEQRDVEAMRRLLDRAVAASVNGIVITDPTLPDNPIIYANTAFENTTGYSASETVGHNCRFLQADDRDQPQITELSRAINKGRECRVVLRNYKKNGEMFWNELYVSPVVDEEENLTNFIGVQHDITERKVAEDALSAQEAQWRALIENNPSLISLSDIEGNITYYNPGWIEFLGIEASDYAGENWHDYLHPEDTEAVTEGFEQTLQTGDTYINPSFRIRRHDGEYRWFSTVVSPVKDEGGEVKSWITVSTDIEDRRQGEIALRESEERLRIAIHSTGLGTWDFNPVTGELRWDERTKEMFGLPPEFSDITYDTFLEGVHPEDRDRMDRTVASALDPHGSGDIDTEFRTLGIEDGRQRWIRTVGRTFFEQAGEDQIPVRFIGTVLDITRTKTAQQERDLLLAREQLARSEAVAARRRLSFLVDADATLLSSVGYFERLRDAANLAIPHLADWCIVDIMENGLVEQVASAHADPEKQSVLDELQRRRNLGEGSSGISARVFESGSSEFAPKVSEEYIEEFSLTEERREFVKDLGMASLISVPLLARGKTLGVMTFVSSSPDRTYRQEDLALAENFAYRCAMAVDNAKLYRDRSRIARTLQRSLLPRLPRIDELDVGLEYLPVGEEALVGGDFYDVIRTSDGGIFTVVGDVCGKGPAAAAVTALARYTIQAVVMKGERPVETLKSLNEAMLRQRDDMKFCTVACSRLEAVADAPGSFDMTLARGGHSAPLLLHPDGSIERLEPPGRALGIFDDASLEGQNVRLSPGDTVVFYTDGLTEARDGAGNLLGEDRLVEILSESVGQDAMTLATMLKDTALEFGDGSPKDDLAVLVIKVPTD